MKSNPTTVAVVVALWLGAVAALAFFVNLGAIGLVDETEPLFAEAARQMLVTGDWITPRFNGEPQFDYPPLAYWLMGGAYRLVGVNEWGARLPSALSALGLAGVSFYALYRFGPLRDPHSPKDRVPRLLTAGLGATLVMLTPEIVVWARAGVADALLAFWVTLAIVAFFCAYAGTSSREKIRWSLVCYASLGLGTLTKGPVALVLPGLAIGAFVLYLGNWRVVLRDVRPPIGVLIVMAIVLPWFVAETWIHGPRYLAIFFGHHNVERFTAVVDNQAGPWYVYAPIVLGGFLPFSLFLPLAIGRVAVWRRRWWCEQPRTAHLPLLAVVCIAGIMVFFSIAVTKRPSYVLPLLPAAAMLVALLWREPGHERGMALTGWASVVVFLALAAAFWRLPRLLGFDPGAPTLAQAVTQSRVHLALAVVFGAAAILSAGLLLRRRPGWLWSVNVAAGVALTAVLVTSAIFVLDRERQQPLRRLASAALTVGAPDDALVVVGALHKASVVFYTRRRVYFAAPAAVRETLRRIAGSLPQGSHALVVWNQYDVGAIGLPAEAYETLAVARPYALVRVRDVFRGGAGPGP